MSEEQQHIDNQNVHSEDENERQRIFEERYSNLTNEFAEACEREGVDIAVAIAAHPEEEFPIVFIRGHKYDVASIMAYVMRSIKSNINEELNTGTIK